MSEFEKAENLEPVEGKEKTGIEPETDPERDENPTEEKKYTDADLDRIIAKRIARERNRLSKMFKDEQEESDMEKRERDITRRELKADARERLSDAGYPVALADILNYEDNDAFEESYEQVTDIFTKALGKQLKKAFSGGTPKASMSPAADSLDDKIRQAFARDVK